MSSESRPGVFISHSSKDAQFARALSQALERRGLRAWYVGLARSTEPVQRRLEEALESSEWHLLLLSEQALSSRWVQFELGTALGKSKHLIPVYLSGRARRQARTLLPHFAPDVDAINAEDLRPKEVADRVAELVQQAA